MAARGLRHMLLFSSLSPEAAWQQTVFTAYLPTLMLSLPPPQVGATTPAPREPGDRRSGHPNDEHPLPHTNQGSPGHTTGLAKQEMIKECLLSTSGQQRAAPSLSSPLLPQVLVPIYSLVKQLSSTYQVPSTKY